MSVFRRLYNVAYGKVRAWQSPEPEERSADESTGTLNTAATVAALRESLGRLEAEAGTTSPEVREEQPNTAVKPRPRQL